MLFCSPVTSYLIVQIKMADDDTIKKLLELYQECKRKGDTACLLMETKSGKDSITFTVNKQAGAPAVNSPPRRRWKTPSQLKRDKLRRDKFLAKKLENPTVDDETEKVLLVEPKDEISLEVEMCEKVFVIPRHKIDNHNIGIEYDVKRKLEAKSLKVIKVKIERNGDPIRGEFTRCEVLIEPADTKFIEKENFEIKNCCVLPYT